MQVVLHCCVVSKTSRAEWDFALSNRIGEVKENPKRCSFFVVASTIVPMRKVESCKSCKVLKLKVKHLSIKKSSHSYDTFRHILHQQRLNWIVRKETQQKKILHCFSSEDIRAERQPSTSEKVYVLAAKKHSNNSFSFSTASVYESRRHLGNISFS